MADNKNNLYRKCVGNNGVAYKHHLLTTEAFEKL